jgi:hypothetical protein
MVSAANGSTQNVTMGIGRGNASGICKRGIEEMKLLRRIRYTWILYTGNLWPSNRKYWGWIKLSTAWEAAGCLV